MIPLKWILVIYRVYLRNIISDPGSLFFDKNLHLVFIFVSRFSFLRRLYYKGRMRDGTK
jgi:hypothetical protein